MKLKKLTLIWLMFWTGALAGVWSEPQRLVLYDVGSNIPSIIIDNKGIAWSVFSPWVLNYPDDNTGWQLVSDSCYPGGLSNGNSACFDKGDTLWVFNGNFDQIFYTRYDGANWSEVDTVPAFPDGNSTCLVTRDSSGGIWLNWLYYACYSAYNCYKDGVWGEPQLVPDTVSGQDWNITLSTDALGRVWFGWLSCWNDYSLECRYIDNGVWSDQMTLRRGSNTSMGIGNMDFAPDLDGGMWAVWLTETSNGRVVETRRYSGGKWDNIDTIPNAYILSNSGYSPMPKIAVDRYGRAWAVWRQALVPKDAYCDIYYSFNSGTGWSKPQPVNTNPAVDMLPDIAVDGKGRVWCVWVSNRDDSSGVWASYATGAGVEEPVTPVTPAQNFVFEVKSIPPSSPFVSYSLPIGEHGIISLFDATGRRIESLPVMGEGNLRFKAGLPVGVYFARLESKKASVIRRVVVFR